MKKKISFKFTKFLMMLLGLVLVASPFLFLRVSSNAVFAEEAIKTISVQEGFTKEDELNFQLPQSLENEQSENEPQRVSSYNVIEMNNVHLNVDVNETGVLDIEYIFDVTFLEDGLSEILITVPYKGTIYREENGKVTKTPYLATISNYNVFAEKKGNEKLNFYSDLDNEVGSAGFVTFGIQDYSFALNETRRYALCYSYDMHNSGLAVADEVYFNLLGYNSSVPINNFTFKITFPKAVDFNEYAPVFYYGKAGSVTEFEGFEIQNGNTIVSTTAFNLNPYESFTIWQLLPKGYLSVNKVSTTWPIVAVIVSAVVAVLAIALKLIFRQKGEVVSPVEFRAPEGITPDVAEYYAKFKVTNKSAGGLIIYLANLGYIKVKTTEDEKHEPVSLIKVRDLPEDESKSIKRVFNAMFDGKDEVNIDELNNEKFYNSFNYLRTQVEAKHGENMFEPNSKKGINFANILMIAALLFNMLALVFASIKIVGFLSSYIFTTLFVLFCVLGVKLIISVLNKAVLKSNGTVKSKFDVIISIIYVAMFTLFYFIYKINLFDPYFLILIANVVLVISNFVKATPRYKAEAARTRGSVLGLKNYIVMAEKDRLEVLVQDNPNLYFDILPYAYVLDISDVWMEKFKDIHIPAPAWVMTSGNIDIFDVIIVSSIINNLNTKVNSSILSQARQASARNFSSGNRGSSGGSGRSFGGFSGGGFAGGGGGGASFGAR